MDPDRNLGAKHHLNEDKLKTLISDFQKTINENEKLRAKYMQDPNKFAVSETELFAKLDELQSVPDQPSLYNVLVEKRVHKLLCKLIFHDNVDISGKAIIVIQELINVDKEDENSHTEEFLSSLFHNQLCDNLIANFQRLDIKLKDEAEIVNNSIEIINYMIGPGCFGYEGHLYSAHYIEWAVKQLKAPKFNIVKLSMIDLLITILSDQENADHFYEINGISALLHQIAYYRRAKASTGSEIEYLHQVLYCLCDCLSCYDEEVIPTKDHFFEEEGVELVELILREKRDGILKTAIKYYMLKAFSICINGSEKIVTVCCERFIEILGLRVLFPIFMKPSVIVPKPANKREAIKLKNDIQEYTIGIIASLMKHCQKSDLLQRILIKFAEKNFEKFDHLINLITRYFNEYKVLGDLIEANEKKGESVPDSVEEKYDRYDSVLRDLIYIFLLICYLSEQHETYDVNSGEKFSNRYKNLLTQEKCDLKQKIIDYTRKIIEREAKVVESVQDRNSLSLLLNHMEKISKVEKKE